MAEETFRLVAVGNLYPVKNHGALVRVLGALRGRGIPAELDVLGRGAEEASLRSEIARLDALVESRVRSPESGGYTRRLLDDRNVRLKKLGEEAVELAVACADGDRARVVSEAADLAYHLVVALRAAGAGWDELERELRSRSE